MGADCRHRGRVEKSRRDVDQLHRLGDACSGALAARQAHDERHAQQFFEQSVRVPAHQAVFTELFAVVGGEDHEAPLEEPALGEAFQQAAEARVHLVDFGVVGRHDVLAIGVGEREPALVGGREQIDADPGWQAALVAGLEPAQCRGRGFVGVVDLEGVEKEEEGLGAAQTVEPVEGSGTTIVERPLPERVDLEAPTNP